MFSSWKDIILNELILNFICIEDDEEKNECCIANPKWADD